MVSEKYNQIITFKNFYRNNLRRCITVLFLSFILNIGLLLAIYFLYLTQPPAEYYATNGVGSPQKLQGLNEPNKNSYALLAPDPELSLLTKSLPDNM